MSEPMTDGELTAIEARCNAATPGPWTFAHGGLPGDDGWSLRSDNAAADVVKLVAECWPCSIHGGQKHREELRFNGDFIAHARTDVPALIDEVKRLRAQNERLNMRLSKAFKVGADCCRRMQLEEK